MTEEQRLLSLIAEKCASITINKWLVQVITNEGVWLTAYFAEPPGNRHPQSDVQIAFAPSKLDALTSILKEFK